jgi:ribonuclease P protein component
MSAIARLKRRREFLEVAGSGRKWVAPGLILQAKSRPAVPAAEASGKTGIRVGFTASRKVGIAVLRNRARRRLRAVADEVLKRHAATDHDYVLIARSGTLTRSYPALLDDLSVALRRLRAWRDDPFGEPRSGTTAAEAGAGRPAFPPGDLVA